MTAFFLPGAGGALGFERTFEAAAKTFKSDQNIFDHPELMLDPDFLTFTIGQILPPR